MKIGFIGQGEKWDGTHFARPCHIFSEVNTEAKYEQGVQLL